jgi:hypothetical protein
VRCQNKKAHRGSVRSTIWLTHLYDNDRQQFVSPCLVFSTLASQWNMLDALVCVFEDLKELPTHQLTGKIKHFLKQWVRTSKVRGFGSKVSAFVAQR